LRLDTPGARVGLTTTRIGVAHPAVAGVLVLAATATGWGVAWLDRLAFQGPNVDDYLYTLVSYTIWRPLSGGNLSGMLDSLLHTGANAPLLPLFAAPLSAMGPDVAVLAQLPILLVLCVALFSLARRFTGPLMAWVIAGIVCLSPPVLGWAVMVHMALLATTCSLLVLLFLVKSDWFERTGMSALVGVSFALLAISRSMAPIFILGLVTAIGVMALFVKREMLFGRRLRNAGLACLLAVLAARPWWIINGAAAWRWLVGVGYGASPWAGSTIPVVTRLGWTLRELGLPTTVFLGLGGIVWAVASVRSRGGIGRPSEEREYRALLMVCGIFLAVVLMVLSTTAQEGTAFALPVLVPVILVTLVGAARYSAGRRAIVLGGAILVAISLVGFSTAGQWLPSSIAGVVPKAPFQRAAEAAAGGFVPLASRSASIDREIVSHLNGGSVVVMRDDDLLNSNGIEYEALFLGKSIDVRLLTYNPGVTMTMVDLPASAVVTGRSCAPYDPNVDEAAVETFLRSRAYVVVWKDTISRCNVIRLWQPEGQR